MTVGGSTRRGITRQTPVTVASLVQAASRSSGSGILSPGSVEVEVILLLRRCLSPPSDTGEQEQFLPSRRH